MKHLVSLLVPALFLSACAAPPLSTRAKATRVETRLAVRDSGTPRATNPTLVLLHGWCCDQGFFDGLRPALEAEHRVVSFDFPGHGDTVGRPKKATLEALAGETAELLESLDLTDVVLVGHSMGAPVALLAADRAAERVRGIIAIDALHDLGKAIDRGNLDRLIDSYEKDFEGTMKLAVESMFEPGAPADVIEATRASAVSVDRDYVLGLMASFARFQPEKAVRSANRPIFALQSSAGPATAVEANAAVCRAGYEVEFIDDVGHFFLRTEPERTAQGILDFISRLEKRSSD